jgi:hypothetical protein
VFPKGSPGKPVVEAQVEKNMRQEPIEWILSQEPDPAPEKQKDAAPSQKEAAVPVSGGYLSRPSNIYAEEQAAE